jgi:formate-dependent nitrite reductase membrane component NrfD
MNLELNTSVANPEWRWLIIWYFFLGGIAAGAYVMAALADLFGDEYDRPGVRVAYYVAFPLVSICGLLLIIDLGRPERFWHMMIQSNTFWPMFKWWSPMSAGSWALSAFGAFSFASFAGVLAEDGWLGLQRVSPLAARLRTGWTGRIFALGGSLAAFFLGSYTGVLLVASNQPIWSNTTWIGALFLASAASTGIATMVLLDRWLRLDVRESVIEHLEQLDSWAIVLELIMLAIMAASLGRLAGAAFATWPGILIPAFVVPVGLISPLVVKQRSGTRAAAAASVLVLIGGFVLRAAIVGMPQPFLRDTLVGR